jgi:hypothetical protein
MMAMKERSKRAVARTIAAEHRSLWRRLGALEAAAKAGPGADSARWIAELQALLAPLSEQLEQHFAAEEHSGLIDRDEPFDAALVEAFEGCLAQHGGLLRAAARLGAKLLDVRCASDAAAASGSLRAFLDDLRRHEQEETRLLQALVYHELGGA